MGLLGIEIMQGGGSEMACLGVGQLDGKEQHKDCCDLHKIYL